MKLSIEAGTRLLAGRKHTYQGGSIVGIDFRMLFCVKISRAGGNSPYLSKAEATGQENSPNLLGHNPQ